MTEKSSLHSPVIIRPSWNDIYAQADRFANKWKNARYEKSQTHSFYDEFFRLFGTERESVGIYESMVRKLDNRSGYIDLFWPGTLIVEQKSKGRNLESAFDQALEYAIALPPHERPRYVLVSDFQTFELHNFETRVVKKFKLADLSHHVKLFAFMRGDKPFELRGQDPVDVKAAEALGRLHDQLHASNYRGHDLERFLVRIVFCLFAEDTDIFEQDGFLNFIQMHTTEDGRDVGVKLIELFQVLDTPDDQRITLRDEDISAFPYVNGLLFANQLRIPAFNREMRDILIEVCLIDWSHISPSIFGALFQSVMEPDERREQGAHYTAEQNILKLINPLFMDDLRAEFAAIGKRDRRAKLQRFQAKLAELRFLDPACGCGNFLIIAYRELRMLELEVIRALREASGAVGMAAVNLEAISLVNVDQFYGIELKEFPARIAETAMWMMDHIMNRQLSRELGESYMRIPLKNSSRIEVGNALDLDWRILLSSEECAYVLGNPPFVGHQNRKKEQKEDMGRIWGNAGQFNRLDYVTCWFQKAAQYAKSNSSMQIAFVATNSITQGEQCGIFWPALFSQGLSIRYAHRTFQWKNEARGKAAVHCVIVGLTFDSELRRRIFEYDDIRGDPRASEVERINGYLIDGPQYSVPARSRPPSGRLKMHKGSQPTDAARQKDPEGGYSMFSNLILDSDHRRALLAEEPNAEEWLRPYVGGEELISGQWRWCLWLKHVDPSQLKASKPIVERLGRVRLGRLRSPTPSVRKFADFPTLFTQDRQPDSDYLAVPKVSSETRQYIPLAILPPDVIASDMLQIIPRAPIYYFGILTSAMHMAWVRSVSGRLKSDYRYSPSVYNSFPWPSKDADLAPLQALSQAILDAREQHSDATLADLYHPITMPPNLRRAHQMLDRAVDKLYRAKGFKSERERVEHLFKIYESLRGDG